MKNIFNKTKKIFNKDKSKNNKKEIMIDNIIKTKDVEQFKILIETDLIDLLIKLNYDYYHKMSFESLNHEQKVLFLCICLEDACQADTILSLYEDNMMLKMPEIYEALIEIGAPNTASLVKEFIELLPDNTFKDMKLPEWNWLWENYERKEKITNIDREISDYPDGSMKTIYYQYVMKEEVIEKLLDIKIMKYFVTEYQRIGTGYHEFSKGHFDGVSFWKEDSLLIDDGVHMKLGLGTLFISVIPTYDHFGEIEVNKDQWQVILEKAHTMGGDIKECIDEADQWVQRVFEEYDVFTIIGV